MIWIKPVLRTVIAYQRQEVRSKASESKNNDFRDKI